MTVTVKGLSEVLRDLEKELGSRVTDKVAKEALEAGAKELVKELNKEFIKFKKTGDSIREITVGKYENIRGERRIRVHWAGDKGRYRIIHLNEWGTVQNPRPRGFGAVARAMQKTKKSYIQVTENVVRKYMS